MIQTHITCTGSRHSSSRGRPESRQSKPEIAFQRDYGRIDFDAPLSQIHGYLEIRVDCKGLEYAKEIKHNTWHQGLVIPMATEFKTAKFEQQGRF
jgi:hypothetical protein